MFTVDFDLLAIRPGQRVLDVGCGEGRHACRAYEEGSCTVCALDLDPASVARTSYLLHLKEEEGQNRAGYLALRGDALRLPFRDTHFDRVICSEVLEHVADDAQAIEELTRVLKDDGTLAISVPTYFSETVYWGISRDYHNQPGGHVRKYRLRQLVSLLRQQGLSVFAVRRKHGLHFFYWLLKCIFGIDRQRARLPALYHRFLVWDIMTGSRPVRLLESALNPFFAKSVVLYAHKDRKRTGYA